LQLLSRPYEAIFLVLGVALYAVIADCGLRIADFKPLMVAVITVLPAIAITLAQNKQVTGSSTTLPYQLSRYEYGVPASFTIEQNPVPHRVLTPAQWVAERATEDEALLWRKTCKECHTILAAGGAALPKIAPSNITARYMPHANFDHSQHGLVDCSSCHAAALKSQQSSDVLLPGIATCRRCHHAGTEAAESRCFECHTYHDPAKRKPTHSNFSLAELSTK
jgi:hypothetical protein